MRAIQWCEGPWLVRILSLVFLMLAGCGGSNEPDGSTTAVGRSQLILHVATADQGSAGLTPRAVAPGQTRQVGNYCPSPGRSQWPGDSYAYRRRMSYSWTFDTAVPGHRNSQCVHRGNRLLVPVGPERLVIVTGFDQTGAEILRGMGTVDLTQPLQTFTVMLAPVQSNTPLRADAGPDQTVAVGTTVMLLGNGSSDADGSPLTFAWEVARPSSWQSRHALQPHECQPNLWGGPPRRLYGAAHRQ